MSMKEGQTVYGFETELDPMTYLRLFARYLPNFSLHNLQLEF